MIPVVVASGGRRALHGSKLAGCKNFPNAVNEVRGPTRRAPFTIRRDGDFMSADAETRPEERYVSLLLSLREWTNSSTRPSLCSADRRRGNVERVLEHYSRDGP